MRIKPSSHHPLTMKVRPALCCEGFTLSIKQQGYGPDDGNGEFVFNGGDVEWVVEDGSKYCAIQVDQSELLFLRDHLNALFPPDEIRAEK